MLLPPCASHPVHWQPRAAAGAGHHGATLSRAARAGLPAVGSRGRVTHASGHGAAVMMTLSPNWNDERALSIGAHVMQHATIRLLVYCSSKPRWLQIQQQTTLVSKHSSKPRWLENTTAHARYTQILFTLLHTKYPPLDNKTFNPLSCAPTRAVLPPPQPPARPRAPHCDVAMVVQTVGGTATAWAPRQAQPPPQPP